MKKHGHYKVLALRMKIELGGDDRKVGLEQLILFMGQLEDSLNVNDVTQIEFARHMLAAVTGEYFLTAREVDEWFTTHFRQTFSER